MTNAKLIAAIVGVVLTFLAAGAVHVTTEIVSMTAKFRDFESMTEASGQQPIGDSSYFNYYTIFIFASLAAGAVLLGLTAFRNLRYALAAAGDESDDESSAPSSDSQSSQ